MLIITSPDRNQSVKAWHKQQSDLGHLSRYGWQNLDPESVEKKFVSNFQQTSWRGKTYTICISQHQNIARRRSQFTNNANRIRNIKVWDSKWAQDEARWIFEIPVLSDDLHTCHHRDGTETRVISVHRVPHPTPDFLRPSSLCGTNHSYHPTISTVIKSGEHEELESCSIHNLPFTIFGLHIGRIGWKISFDFCWEHLTPWGVWITFRHNRYPNHKLLLNWRIGFLAFFEETVESGSRKSIFPHKDSAFISIIILKEKTAIIVNRIVIDFHVSYLDIFVVRQRLAESIIETRSSNSHAVTIVYHQNLPNEFILGYVMYPYW